MAAGGIGTSVAKLTGDEYFFVRGGVVDQSSNFLRYAGDNGDYWSSTPTTNANTSYRLLFHGTEGLNASANVNRPFGFSIRCVAR